jgi:hypothetical protein
MHIDDGNNAAFPSLTDKAMPKRVIDQHGRPRSALQLLAPQSLKLRACIITAAWRNEAFSPETLQHYIFRSGEPKINGSHTEWSQVKSYASVCQMLCGFTVPKPSRIGTPPI